MTFEKVAAGIQHFPTGNCYNLNSEICVTCQNYNMETGRCKWLDITPHIDFICDGYRRKRSGQYRRKRAKYNKG